MTITQNSKNCSQQGLWIILNDKISLERDIAITFFISNLSFLLCTANGIPFTFSVLWWCIEDSTIKISKPLLNQHGLIPVGLNGNACWVLFWNFSELTMTRTTGKGSNAMPNTITLTLKIKVVLIKSVNSTVILLCDWLYHYRRSSLHLKQHRNLQHGCQRICHNI